MSGFFDDCETVICEPAFTMRGPKVRAPRAPSRKDYKKSYKKIEAQRKREARLENIAILDMETDPFDAERDLKVHPFLAVLYSDNFDPVVIWDEHRERFLDKVIKAIASLDGAYTIYAHNGGKFDYMFLVSRLRGAVMFKGRGIMSAKIGQHELRDSFHIIPEKLANWHKDSFDYEKMRRGKRRHHKQEIIDYCINDCRYLLDIVKKFVGWNGLKLSIGQAAMMHLRKEYKVDKIGDAMDNFLRQWFFGGRVECIQGAGHFVGDYKLYDVNSMYPYVMARYAHPQGANYIVRDGGRVGPNCCFLELQCDNENALVRRGENNETSGRFASGRFFTTIHEYRVAMKYSLISNVKIVRTIDCDKLGDFSRVIEPMYERRIETKSRLRLLPKGSFEYNEAKKDDMILKFLLNNMYGKFAQNPRRYQEHYVTDPNEAPEIETETWGALPTYECGHYWIWQRPNPNFRFNNVGTAASITGAARAVLLEAIQNSRDPIYCDTDSLICRDLRNAMIDPTLLGAWDIEQVFDEVIVTGKKQYACRVAGAEHGQADAYKLRSKGVSGLTWKDYLRMLDDEVIETLNRAPTMTKTGTQIYMRRKVRATAPRLIKRKLDRRLFA